MKEGFGVEEGLMTTVHGYGGLARSPWTAPTRKKWGRMGTDLAGTNIIPQPAGAATQPSSLVIPELKGRLTGMSFRVPTPTVSVVDLSVRISRGDASLEEINAAMQQASETYLKEHPGPEPPTKWSPATSSTTAWPPSTMWALPCS